MKFTDLFKKSETQTYEKPRGKVTIVHDEPLSALDEFKDEDEHDEVETSK